MYLGAIVELADTDTLFRAPAHPCTEALLKAATELDPARRSVIDAVRGELPSPLALPAGCPFHRAAGTSWIAAGSSGLCSRGAGPIISRPAACKPMH